MASSDQPRQSMYFTRGFKHGILGHLFRGQPLALVGQPHVALHTGWPGPDGKDNEVSGQGYTRQPMQYADPADGGIRNSETVIWGPAEDDWGKIRYQSIWNAAVGGACICVLPVIKKLQRDVLEGDAPMTNAGIMLLSLTGGDEPDESAG